MRSEPAAAPSESEPQVCSVIYRPVSIEFTPDSTLGLSFPAYSVDEWFGHLGAVTACLNGATWTVRAQPMAAWGVDRPVAPYCCGDFECERGVFVESVPVTAAAGIVFADLARVGWSGNAERVAAEVMLAGLGGWGDLVTAFERFGQVEAW